MRCGGHQPSREGTTQVSRRRMLRSIGAGVGLLSLGTVTGCSGLWATMRSTDTESASILAQGKNESIIELLKAAEKSWQKSFQILTLKSETSGGNRMSLLIAEINRAKNFTRAAFTRMEASGLSTNIERNMAQNTYDRASASQHWENFKKKYNVNELPPDAKEISIITDYILGDKRKIDRAIGLIQQEDGLFRHVRKGLSDIDARAMARNLQTAKNPNTVLGQQTCSTALALCSAAAAAASVICGDQPDSEECASAAAVAAAFCAAACVACGGCGGGGGGEDLTP